MQEICLGLASEGGFLFDEEPGLFSSGQQTQTRSLHLSSIRLFVQQQEQPGLFDTQWICALHALADEKTKANNQSSTHATRKGFESLSDMTYLLTVVVDGRGWIWIWIRCHGVTGGKYYKHTYIGAESDAVQRDTERENAINLQRVRFAFN